VVGEADTTLTASTESSDVSLRLARTVQFNTGALATQRAVRIDAPTYAFVGASTITDAATLYVAGAPAAGTNATITNTYALWVDAGNCRFDGILASADGAAGGPAFTFASDTDTGMYRSAVNNLDFATAGANRLNLSSAGTVSTAVYVAPTGAVGAPSYTFSGDTDTGIWRAAADTLAISTAGSEQVRVNASGYVGIGTTTPAARLDVTPATFTAGTGSNERIVYIAGAITEASSGTHTRLMGLQLVAPTITGAAAAVTDTATLYIDAAMSATVTGANYAVWVDAGNVRVDAQILGAGAGALAATPPYSFQSDTNTGIFSSAADTLDFSTGGTARVTLSATSLTTTLNVLPSSTNTIDLGSSGSRFRTAYLGTSLDISSTSSTVTAVTIVADSVDNEPGMSLSVDGLTTSRGIAVTGPDSGTGFTGSLIYGISTSMGTAAKLLHLVGTSATAGASNTGYGAYIDFTNTPTANSNSVYGVWSKVTDTTTARANTNYALYGEVSDTTVTTVTRTNYGGYFRATKTGTSSGTVATYGVYASATGDAGGTSTAYGLYATASGADTNWAGYFDGRAAVFSTTLDGATAGVNNQHLRLWRSDNTDGTGPGIAFTASTGSTNIGAKIVHIRETGQTESRGHLAFYTKGDSTVGDTTVERMRIQADGTVAIGYTGTEGDGGIYVVNSGTVASSTGATLSHEGNLTSGTRYGAWVQARGTTSGDSTALYCLAQEGTVNLAGQFIVSDTSATVTDTIIVEKTNRTGAGVSGIGSAILFRAEDTANAQENTAQIRAWLTDATSASEDSALAFYTRAAGAALTEQLRIGNTGQLTVNLGSVGTPTYSFIGDTNTGIYSSTNNNIDFATLGVNRLNISSAGLNSTVVCLAPDGSASACAYAFSSDTNTGLYRSGADALGFATGGTQRLDLTTTRFTMKTALIFNYYHAAAAVTAGGTLTPTSSMMRLTATSPVTLDTTTAIADGLDGDLLILMGTDDTNTVTINNGANTDLAANRTLALRQTLTLVFDATSGVWVEVSYSAN